MCRVPSAASLTVVGVAMVDYATGRPCEALGLGAQPIAKSVIALFVHSLAGGGAQRDTLTLAQVFAAREPLGPTGDPWRREGSCAARGAR